MGLMIRSPVIIFAGAGCFIVISVLLVTSNGLTEYTGTTNSTYYFNASSNVTTTTQAANYTTNNDYLITGMSIVYILAGLYGMFYGATLPPKTGITE
jgi:uncharacterized membrane protein YfcA